jgi:hypothetical protein
VIGKDSTMKTTGTQILVDAAFAPACGGSCDPDEPGEKKRRRRGGSFL